MTLIRGAHAGKPAAPLRRMPRADSARHRPCERRQPPALATGCLSCVRACESGLGGASSIVAMLRDERLPTEAAYLVGP